MVAAFQGKLKRASWLLWPILLVAVVGEGTAAPRAPVSLAPISPGMNCSDLSAVDVSAAVGAKTTIDSVMPITRDKPAPYCQVRGTIAPAIKFEVRLPLTGWTQRFVQTGCGGLCGDLNIRLGNADGCMPAQRGEFVLASTDMGHSGSPDGQWGKSYSARIDFAYRGVHLTAVAAKALIEKYYGQKARYSYFAGCSDGGREALMEAQRYPQDFNGITAGAPAMNFTTQNTFYHGWNARQNTDAAGHAILTADKLPILHQAVLMQCDAADGLKDGLISDPVNCHVKVDQIQCRAGQQAATCLTAEQVHVAEEIYLGAHDAAGHHLVISGPLPGSELNWAGVYVPPPGQDSAMSGMISEGTIKYLAYDPNPAPSFRLADFKFDAANFAATTRLHGLYDATDPDLSAFAMTGGKLILWHGLADPHISPLNTIAYYGAMQRVLGGDQVNEFARLFLFPGGAHCGGGEGPFDMDLMSAIMAWVESARAPAVIIASHGMAAPGSFGAGLPPDVAGVPRGGPGLPPPGMMPMGPGAPPVMQPSGSDGPPASSDAQHRVARTRPIYPYPQLAQYTGQGSIDDAANFKAVPPSKPWPTSFTWLGEAFYTPHYETWCTATRDDAHADCQMAGEQAARR